MSYFWRGAENRYIGYRVASYEDLVESVRSKYPRIDATPIDAKAIEAWSLQWRTTLTDPTGRGGWNWRQWRAKKTFEHYTRYELALWSGGILCGLAIGSVSAGRNAVHVHLIEGHPDPGHPLKRSVTSLVAANAQAYCLLFEGSMVRFLDPNPGLWELFEKLKYLYVPGGDGLPDRFEKVITPYGSGHAHPEVGSVPGGRSGPAAIP